MDAVKVGQVWHDKDKRRDRTVTVIDQYTSDDLSRVVLVKDTATGKESELSSARFVKRWELVKAADALDKRKREQLRKVVKEITKPEPGEPLYSTREAWLEAGVEALIPLFKDIPDVEIPKVRVSVGWPGGRGPKGQVIGQCWKTNTATDSISQIFISPVVDDPKKALATLAHELIHASDDGASGHKGHFARTAKTLGFTGKLTAVLMNGEISATPELVTKITGLAEKLGPYPHAALSERAKPKTQKTYMLKLVSEDCDECGHSGYMVRMTQKWLNDFGAPLCPHGVEMIEE